MAQDSTRGSLVPLIWTEAHLKDIEQNFPETVAYGSSDQLQYKTGQRSVVYYIRQQVLRRA